MVSIAGNTGISYFQYTWLESIDMLYLLALPWTIKQTCVMRSGRTATTPLALHAQSCRGRGRCVVQRNGLLYVTHMNSNHPLPSSLPIILRKYNQYWAPQCFHTMDLLMKLANQLSDSVNIHVCRGKKKKNTSYK